MLNKVPFNFKTEVQNSKTEHDQRIIILKPLLVILKQKKQTIGSLTEIERYTLKRTSIIYQIQPESFFIQTSPNYNQKVKELYFLFPFLFFGSFTSFLSVFLLLHLPRPVMTKTPHCCCLLPPFKTIQHHYDSIFYITATEEIYCWGCFFSFSYLFCPPVLLLHLLLLNHHQIYASTRSISHLLFRVSFQICCHSFTRADMCHSSVHYVQLSHNLDFG